MVFSSITFLFYFLPAFLIFYFLLPWKNLTLLVFSLLFYGWGEPRFLPILIAYIIVNYAFGLLLNRESGRTDAILIGGLIANFGLLLYFKYANFLTEQMSWLAKHLGAGPLPVSHVILPLGISFISFQGASYLIDVYRGVVPPQRSLLKFAMYKSMFPQLIAGPIVRYSDIAADIDRRPTTLDNLFNGAQQFMIGLGQKVLIANVVARPADQIFSLGPADLSTGAAWLGITCYTLQIYFDFAGYSNMAIGLGRVMGFTYPINFDRPYASQSITEFWRRWHITLSRWFRDYLYIPLGGNRYGAFKTYSNLMVVFVLCGFWHGASWTFLVWGIYHGTFLVIERLGLGSLLHKIWRPARHTYVILAIMGGWVFFRSDSIHRAISFFKALAGGGSSSMNFPFERFLSPSVEIAIILGAILSVAQINRQSAEQTEERWSLRTAGSMLVLAIFALSVLAISSGAYNPFIYYRF